MRARGKGTGRSANKAVVERYMDGFRRLDHAQILSCLTDDVEWVLPGLFHKTGKAAFDAEIENDAFTGRPEIAVSRLIEEGGVVVAEGTVRTRKKTGERPLLAFCDVFELRGGKIRRLVSYLAEIKEA